MDRNRLSLHEIKARGGYTIAIADRMIDEADKTILIPNLSTHPLLPKLPILLYLRPMRIGFDAKRIFQNTTGLGNYSRTVVKNLAEFYPENEYFLFTPTLKNKLPFAFNKNTHMVVGRGSVWRSFGVRRDIVKHNVDIYQPHLTQAYALREA